MDEVRFEPVVLKWAREKRFGPRFKTLEENWTDSWTTVTPELIDSWEKGKTTPSFHQVRKLAEIYKRPLAAFFLESPPEELSNPPDLRTLGSKDNKTLSPETLLAIRKARRVQELTRDLRDELTEKIDFKFPKYSIETDTSSLAEEIRDKLLISIEDQTKVQKYEDFFEYLRSKIEATGIITLKSGTHDSFPTEDCRAFSFADVEPYVILINNKDTDGAKNFSLIHEFAHILIREAGVCNNFRSFGNQTKYTNKIEIFCNQFAASFLVPKEHLKNHKLLKNRTTIPLEDFDETTEKIAKTFKVSRYVILRRLLTLGYIDSSVYGSKTKEWSEDILPPKKGGGTFSLRTTLLKNGKAFSSLVIEAYRRNKISFSSISDYIGLKTKHLSSFEKIVNRNDR